MSKVAQNSYESGRKARDTGNFAESEFDAAALYYQNNGLIDIQPTYPQFVPLGFVQQKNIRGGKKGGNPNAQVAYGYFKADSQADRVISLKELNGQTCWVEIKSVSGANTMTIKGSRHQYDQMKQAQADGGALAFYAVYWQKAQEWRLYPLESVQIPLDSKDPTTVKIERESGILMHPLDQWNSQPDWYSAVMEYVKIGIH